MAPLRWRSRTAAGAVILLLAGCASAPTASAPTWSTPPRLASLVSASPVPAPGVLDGLSLEQRVGQLFMVGSSALAADDSTMAAVRDYYIGSVFLSGRSSAGVEATAAVVAALTEQSPGGAPLLVATDQEGGQVQVLSGTGFSSIPTARTQGRMAADELAASAEVWGAELAAAGVNVNLAPVADIITGPSSGNQPIARYHREYGYDAATVAAQAGAFITGMTSAGVASTAKHFPGLGYVTGNTDVSSSVVDYQVDADSDVVQAFGALVDDGAPMVMMSSAVYALIDPSAPAVFSPTAVGLLRDSLGFEGIIMTDDLSAAAQVQAWTPAERAVLAIEAGVDIVLVVHHLEELPEMIDAVMARAQADPVFAARVDSAARGVLLHKIVFSVGGSSE